MKFIKMYGEDTQRIKLNHVFFELRDFCLLQFTHKVINKVKLDHLYLDCVMWDTQSNSVMTS